MKCWHDNEEELALVDKRDRVFQAWVVGGSAILAFVLIVACVIGGCVGGA